MIRAFIMGPYTLICRCLLATILLAWVPHALGADFCNEAEISKTGISAGFNRDQCKAFNAPLRTENPQVGDTCVCESLLNVAFDLGIPGRMEDIQQLDCDGPNFGDMYGEFAKTQQMQGRVFGGIAGLFRTMKLKSADNAIDDIIHAVSAGKVVAISLDPVPIYDEIARETGISYTWVSHTAAHALVIRALRKDEIGQVVAVGIVDSSGPGRKYWIPMRTLIQAYKSLRSIAARGVYISDSQRKSW